LLDHELKRLGRDRLLARSSPKTLLLLRATFGVALRFSDRQNESRENKNLRSVALFAMHSKRSFGKCRFLPGTLSARSGGLRAEAREQRSSNMNLSLSKSKWFVLYKGFGYGNKITPIHARIWNKSLIEKGVIK
jgi:hypothetical protein